MAQYSDNKAYRKFITSRDKALETILQNTQKDFSRLLHPFLEFILEQCAARHIQFDEDNYKPATIKRTEAYIRSRIKPVQTEIEAKMKKRYLDMRNAVYVLTYYAEGEALGRVKQKTINLADPEVKEIKTDTATKDFEIYLSETLDQIVDKALKAFTSALINWELKPYTLKRVTQSFPKPTKFRKKKQIAKVTEAAPKKVKVLTDFVTEPEWEKILDQYKDAYLPATRFFNDAIVNANADDMKYAWQIEKQLTQAFVKDVADGTLDAGTEAGIKDFVWIAVLDDKTCEHCCRPRDGMTLTEIEKAIKDGTLDGDHCDARVPPAHFNCRCRIVAIDKDIPMGSAKGVKEFEEWLDS